MNAPRKDSLTAPSPLLQAALAGLLSLSLPACGGDDENSQVTSTQKIELDADGFKSLCDERGGTVEVMVHCGGLATGPGFAYDIQTRELTEHTCKGVNTCSGWNCLIDE
jgi:hypothetical protein